MSDYLILYENDSFKKQFARYTLHSMSYHQAWDDNEHDKLSSFRYHLEAGRELRIHLHSEEDSPYQAWRGTGEEEHVDKNEIEDWLHDEASSHSIAKI